MTFRVLIPSLYSTALLHPQGAGPHFGGSEVRAVTLAKEWQRAFSPFDIQPVMFLESSAVRMKASGDGIECHAHSGRNWSGMADELARLRWDVALCFGAHEVSHAVARAARETRRPWVFGLANDNQASNRVPSYTAPFLADAMRHAPRVVAQSREQAALLANTFKVPAHWASSPCPMPLQPTPFPNGRKALWIGRTVDKGHADLLALADALAPYNWSLTIVCNNFASLSNAWRAELQARPNVRATDRVPLERAQLLLGTHDCVINTSADEGMPNLWLQAGAAGRPIVSLAVNPGGVLTRTGQIGPARSVRELVALMHGRSASGWQAAGTRWFEYVRDHHDPMECAGQWAEHLHAVAGAAHSPTLTRQAVPA